MEQALQKLGLNEKESKFYIFLLEKGALTAAQVAKELRESRTNTYMVLDRLVEQELITTDDKVAVRRYLAADPSSLKKLLFKQQQMLKQNQVVLASVLPQLSSTYQLGQHKPGVVYLEGIAGYKQSLADMAKSDQQVSVLGSYIAPENLEAWAALEEYAHGRDHKAAHSRILLSQEDKGEVDIKKFSAKGYELRFWGVPHDGEIAIYGNKIALTVYKPTLVVTVITNEVLAQTFRIIYDQLWNTADCS